MNHFRSRARGALAACLLALTCLPLAGSAQGPEAEAAPQASAPAAEPSAVVERLHAVLIEVMQQAESLGYEGRYARLEPVLPEVFDLPFMAEKSVGRHWKTATGEERQALLSTFQRFSIANYAGRFEGYSGQQFETLGTEPSAHKTLLVRTRLVDPQGDEVKLDYRLRRRDGHWKIIDVYLNGTVSELALRRSEYSALIKREGFQALLAALDERIHDFATSPADHAS